MNNGGIHMSDEKSYTADSLQGATDFPAPNNQPLIAPEEIRLQVEALSAYYGNTLAVNKVSLSIKTNRVTAIIGPSGCGKSTFIRCLNRMHEVTPGARVEGQVLLDGQDLYGPGIDPVDVRRRVGMVFQKPNVFPSMSIHDNVAAGYKLNGVRDGRLIAETDETSLQNAVYWEEGEDDLQKPGTSLSGGQQQRLCMARALAVDTEVLLMDEPCSALDPIATAKIEELIFDLKKEYTVVVVTHNMQQAARVADYTAFLYLGKLIEVNRTRELFERPG